MNAAMTTLPAMASTKGSEKAGVPGVTVAGCRKMTSGAWSA